MFYIERDILVQLKQSLKEHFYISALIGPRQVGKTTLLNKLGEFLEQGMQVEKKRIFYFNFDNADLRNKAKADFKYILKEIEAVLGAPLTDSKMLVYLFIDEAQKVPEIFDLVKMIFDENQDKIKIFLSGSSSFNIRKNSAETLAGRIRFFYLYPFTIREITQHILSKNLESSLLDIILSGNFTKDGYSKLQSQIYASRENIFPIWNQSIVFGFLPKIFQLENLEDKRFYLRDFIDTYLEKDIRLLKEIGDVDLFSRVLDLFISQDSQLLNTARISNNFDISRITLTKYLSILKETNVVSLISTFSGKISKKLIKSPKIIFFDNGFINYHSKIFDREQLLTTGKIGSVFENIIINNILRHIENSSTPPNVYFYRDYQGHEIDIVVETADKIIPIEITYSSKIIKDKIKNFRAFYKDFPQSEDGFIVYSGDFDQASIDGKTITAIPFWMWW